MKSERESADKKQSEHKNKNEQVNIPGPQELPDQQKVGEPDNDKSTPKPKPQK